MDANATLKPTISATQSIRTGLIAIFSLVAFLAAVILLTNFLYALPRVNPTPCTTQKIVEIMLWIFASNSMFYGYWQVVPNETAHLVPPALAQMELENRKRTFGLATFVAWLIAWVYLYVVHVAPAGLLCR